MGLSALGAVNKGVHCLVTRMQNLYGGLTVSVESSCCCWYADWLFGAQMIRYKKGGC